MEKWSTHLAGQWKEVVVPCKHLKNSGFFNRIWTHDLCDAITMLHQLSYEAIQIGGGQIICWAQSYSILYFKQ